MKSIKFITTCLIMVIFSGLMNAQSAKKYYNSGEEFFEAKKYSDAVTQFTSSLGLDPGYKDVWYQRGLCYELLGDYKNAAPDFSRAIVYDPKNEEIYFHLGKAYFELKQYDEALAALSKALNLDKKYMPAIQQKILVLLAVDQILNALSLSDSAVELDNTAQNFYLSGLVAKQGNSYAKAEKSFTNSIKEDKKFVAGYIELADLQVTSLNKIPEAFKNVNEALRLEPNSRLGLKVRSKVYLKKLDYPMAINDISSAIVLDPSDNSMFALRADYYLEFKQFQNAINDLNKVIQLDPKNGEAIYKRAACYEEIGNIPSAMKDYNSLIAISEFDAKARKMLKGAQDRIFELNREQEKPKFSLVNPIAKPNAIIEVPNNNKIVNIKGLASDQSAITSIKVNNSDITFVNKKGQVEFSTDVLVDSSAKFIVVSVADVYKNVLTDTFTIVRTEVDAPIVAVIAPVASDNGEIYLDSNDPSIYIEGKITDASNIKSVMIDGMSASFKIDDLNPQFSATIPITNKNKFQVTATDIYGNEKSYTYTLNRDNALLLASNPMGKTWVIFIENANYTTFASLEGPTKDVSLMKSVLVKYQISNIVHKKDLTKEAMEKFFSIELRDMVKSNRVNSLLIYYAGHGKFVNETGYWIPVDAKRDDEFTYFNINVLKAALAAYPTTVTHQLVMTDACESGPSFYQAMRSELKQHNCGDWQSTRLKSSQVFSSAGFELAKDNSQFAKTIANVLATNPDACLPIESIVSKVSDVVGKSNQQKPKFGKIAGLVDEDGTFFFMAK